MIVLRQVSQVKIGMIVLVVTIASSRLLLGLGKTESTPFGGNRFCGPMSLQRTLEYYGIEEDLLTLVREIQWPNTENGSSFQDLSNALHRRGIQTLAINIESLKAFNWPSPAIVQLEFRNSKHFVVWLPAMGDRPATIWDGAQSPLLRKSDVESLLAGPVLLTSASPISLSTHFQTSHPGLPTPIQIGISSLAALVIGIYLASRRQQRDV